MHAKNAYCKEIPLSGRFNCMVTAKFKSVCLDAVALNITPWYTPPEKQMEDLNVDDVTLSLCICGFFITSKELSGLAVK